MTIKPDGFAELDNIAKAMADVVIQRFAQDRDSNVLRANYYLYTGLVAHLTHFMGSTAENPQEFLKDFIVWQREDLDRLRAAIEKSENTTH